MSSFLNIHQTINVHVQRYLNAPVEDSTFDKNDAATNIDFNDYLQMFNGNVEILENARREEDLESLTEPAKEKRQCQAEISINVLGKYICNSIAILFSYFIRKVIQGALYVISLIYMILKTPLMLRQRFFPEQLNERHVEQGRQLVRNVRMLYGLNLATADLLARVEYEQSLREQTATANNQRNMFGLFWKFVLAVCILIIVREITFLRLHQHEHGNLTGMQFNTQVTSQFACRSADNHTVATKPSGDMSCGSTRRLFKYEGVFANTSFLPEQESAIEFSIKFQQLSLQAKEIDDFFIFEFGLTNDSISTKVMFPSIFSVSGVSCQNKFGVCLSIGNRVMIESKDIFKSETNLYFAEGRFILNYQPSTLTLFFLAKFPRSKATIELHRIQPLKLRGMLWPVFAAYQTTSVSMTIKSNHVGFDRFTLYPSLYISDDNKTMSNKQLSGMFPSDSFGTPVIFTRLKNFGTSGEIQTMLNIDFSDFNGGHLLFKFGIGNHEDGVFKGTALLECTECVWTYFFGLYPITGYCVLVKNDTNQMMMGNHLSLFLHYHRNGSIAMFIVNYYFGYSHRIFQFEPFNNQPPKVYIEKMDATDIVISSTEKSSIFNMTKIIIALLVIIYFYMI